MKTYKLTKWILFCGYSMLLSSLQGQFDENNIYIIEDIQSPKEVDMVKAYEGFPSIPFIAKDMNGVEVNLFDFKGEPVLLYFWSQQNRLSLDYLDLMSVVHEDLGTTIISFSNNTKEELNLSNIHLRQDFHVIPNSKTLAEGPYGSELGSPKLFIIDGFGIIKHVLPQSFFESYTEDKSKYIQSLINEL